MLELRYSESLGRHLVATKDIQSGSLMMSEKPFAAVLGEDQKFTHCATCFEESKVKRCTLCKGIAYWYFTLTSSRLCQKEDWKIHKPECLAFQRSNSSLNMTVRFICRVLINLNLSKESNLPGHVFNKAGILSLLGHKDKFDKKKLQDYAILARGLHLILDTKFLLPLEEIIGLFCVSTCNSMSISDADGTIAGGIFRELSLINHSCNANTSISFSGSTAFLISVRPIPKGEQVLISYVDDFISKKERISIIRNTYYFDCKCEWCVSDFEPLHLQAGPNGEIISDLTWKRCKDDTAKKESRYGPDSLSSDEISKRTRFVELCLEQNPKHFEDEKIIEYALKTFQPTHYVMPIIFRTFEKKFRDAQNWQKCTEISKHYCKTYETLYGRNFRYAIACHKVARYAQLSPNPEFTGLALNMNREALLILNLMGPPPIALSILESLGGAHD